jgi:hypothetical protein
MEGVDVTAIAPDAEELRELDAGTRRAWSAYSERLRDLHGDEYERIEHDSWGELQDELQRLDRRREWLSSSAR